MDDRFMRVKDMPNPYTGGHRVVYRLAEPYEYAPGEETEYLCADYATTFDHGPETMLFPCDEDGYVLDWSDLQADPYDSTVADVVMDKWLYGREG